MMKKSKAILILFLVLGMILNPFKKVEAHSIELDPEALISMPYMIMGGSGTITIKNSVENYTLYFQAVQITNTIYSEIEKIQTDGKIELDRLKETYTALKTEVNELKEIYNTTSDAYTEGLKNTGLSQEELERLKTAYEVAKVNYQNKATEYNNKVDEYNAKVNEINAKTKELTPTYVESNWSQTTDNKISIDITQFSGQQPYVIWAKLVTTNGTYYDEDIYTMTGTKATEVNVTGISLNKTTISIEKGSSYTLSATILPSDATDKRVKWSSDNETIATVLAGKVTAKSVGTTTITATTNDGEYVATCKVVVTEKALSQTGKADEINSDTSTAKKILPNTGISNTVIIFIIGISILGFILYKRYKYYNIK